MRFVALAAALGIGLSFVPPAHAAPPATGVNARTVARDLLAGPLPPEDRFRAQIVAGRDAEALRSIRELRERLRGDRAYPAPFYPDEVYARAALASGGRPTDEALRRSLERVLGRLSNLDAAYVARLLEWIPPGSLGRPLQAELSGLRTGAPASRTRAIALIRDDEIAEVYRRVQAVAAGPIRADDRRRYVIARDVLVAGSGGSRVCALIVRPRGPGQRTALLGFTIYADGLRMGEARLTASHGYAGIIGFTRGKACSPDVPVPYEHDGPDADALIRWIARQPWSDGRVGMYGGSYNGFTTWAASKRRPRDIAGPDASGIGRPGSTSRWKATSSRRSTTTGRSYTTRGKGLDDAKLTDLARWDRMERAWYTSGGRTGTWTGSRARPIRSSIAGSVIRATMRIGSR